MSDYATTQGKVLSSKVGIGQSISTGASGHGSRLKEMYFPDVEYEYTINGKTYQNNRFWDEKIQISQLEKIEPIVQQYPAGAAITVYFDPQNPSNSYLEKLPEVNFGRMKMWMVVIAAVIVIAIGLVIFLAMMG